MKEIKKVKKGLVRRLTAYIRPYKGYVAGAVIFSILYVVFVLLGPVLYGEAIDAMIGKGQVDFRAVYIMVGDLHSACWSVPPRRNFSTTASTASAINWCAICAATRSTA